MTDPHRPRVAIILVNYNNAALTDACLASLQTLTHPHDVIVVDNGSTDDSLAHLRARHPDLHLVHFPVNVGFTAANNAGCRAALTQPVEYLWFLNNDTVVAPDALTELVAAARADPALGAVSSLLYEMREPERLQSTGGGHVRLWRGTAELHTHDVPAGELHFVAGTSLLVRRAAIDAVGLLDEGFFMYWEDADFSFRLRRAGWTIAVAPRARVWHLGCASMGQSTREHKSLAWELHFTRSAVRFFRKHAPLPIAPLLLGPGLYLVKRVLRRQWPRARAVASGALQGLRAAPAPRLAPATLAKRGTP
ncbi:glycosyltransferase family 2 protein [Deinococcus maricopensis]|uniref:Glycosyl transferase family 2 n=1 Tax=Deinococcus maricopensis (strain DSM 21211 / LMG 22137 / NRRL B-23946 / LB-34) TaxID=709986 RepID=E8U3E2_DEIML|nr:glycosyltransferase family 2 protein [Deinococcus maricopensis]ADV65813.1 glycosyl transferase family 2 [Deinococcus maricopensis DSM 21211]